MNVACGTCRVVHRVDPSLVPSEGVEATCSRCGATLQIPAAPDDRQTPEWRRVLMESEAEAAPDLLWEAPDPPAPSGQTPDAGEGWFPSAPIPSRSVSGPPSASPAAEERARRLARALVSDLVAYHPARHEAAVAAGTLGVAFREEVAEAYAHLVARVGRGLAEGRPHFVEALNEFLADGRALF